MAISIFPSIHAQNSTTDTSATCIAYWNKGEQKVFLVKHAKQKLDAGKVVSNTMVSYEAHLKVVEATTDGYTLEWSHQNYQTSNGNGQMMSDVNDLMKGLQFRYKTDAEGSFSELLNWQEVRDFYIHMLELSLNKEKDEAKVAAFQTAKQMFQTKESVEGMMIKEIQLYHTPFGVEYDFKGLQAETELPNFTGGEPFPANISLRLSNLAPSKDVATIDYTQNIDKGKAAKQIAEILNKLAPEATKQDGFDNSLFSQLEVADVSQFQLTLSTGWLSKAAVKRTTRLGTLSNIETYEITEKK